MRTLTQLTESRTEYTILIDGTPLPSHFGVLELEVESEVNRIPKAYVVFSDGQAVRATEERDQRDSELFQLGNQLSIAINNDTGSIPVFSGILTNYSLEMREGLATVSLECRHKAYRMTLRPQSRSYRQKTDHEVIEQLLQLYNIETEIADTQYTHSELVQQNCSDWDFMIMRLDANGLYAVFNEKQMNIDAPDFNSEEESETISYEGEVISFKGEIAVQNQFEQVSIRNWESDRLGTQDQPDPIHSDDDNVLGLPKEEGSRHTDLDAVNHPDHDDRNGQTSGTGTQLTRPYVLRSGTPMPSQEMQARANSRQLRNRLSQKQGQLRVRNHRNIAAGDIIELQGFNPDFDGLVYVSKIACNFHQGLWLMDIYFGLCPLEHAERFQTNPAHAGGIIGAIHGLQIGVVQQIHDDPDNAYRIKVRIPVMEEEQEDSGTEGGDGEGSETQEGIWARLATLDAGLSAEQQEDENKPGRGSFFLPEVGDEVIVGFIDDDPRYPIILGMLHSQAFTPPSDFSASENNPQKGFVTRGGLKLLFHEDEDAKSITLETPSANRLLISETDDDGGFDFSDQHGNRILMNKEGIRIESTGKLILKADKDMEQEAGSKWKAKGRQGQLEANGTLNIKGATVNIN